MRWECDLLLVLGSRSQSTTGYYPDHLAPDAVKVMVDIDGKELAKGGVPVVALSGDGAAHMDVQDFATLAYYKLPVKLFVYNNHGYLLIRHNQHNYMGDRFLGVGPVVCEVMTQEFGILAPRIASRVMPDGSLKAAGFDDLWPFLDEDEK